MRLSIPSSRSAVTGLLGIGCPSAVRGRIVAIVVFAIERVLRRWPFSHVLEKRRERVSPACTNRDAATAVSFPTFIVRVCAASDHCAPKHVFRQAVTTSARAMFQCAAATLLQFPQKASATSNLASLHVASFNHSFLPAFTEALPQRSAAAFSLIGSAGKNCKPPEALTSKIAEGWFGDDVRIALSFPSVVVKRTPSVSVAPRFTATNTATPSWMNRSHTLPYCTP